VETPLPRKPSTIGFAIAIIAILIGSVALLYNPYVPEEATTQSWLEDAEGDVEFFGEEEPGIIDVTYVGLEVDEADLRLTLTVRDSVPERLGDGEFSQWIATIILLDGVFETYEVWLEMNSSVGEDELVGYSREIGAEEAIPCTVDRDGNSLSVSVRLDGLESAEEIQWSVLTVFERWSGSELVASGFDSAPDEGLQTMSLDK